MLIARGTLIRICNHTENVKMMVALVFLSIFIATVRADPLYGKYKTGYPTASNEPNLVYRQNSSSQPNPAASYQPNEGNKEDKNQFSDMDTLSWATYNSHMSPQMDPHEENNPTRSSSTMGLQDGLDDKNELLPFYKLQDSNMNSTIIRFQHIMSDASIIASPTSIVKSDVNNDDDGNIGAPEKQRLKKKKISFNENVMVHPYDSSQTHYEDKDEDSFKQTHAIFSHKLHHSKGPRKGLTDKERADIKHRVTTRPTKNHRLMYDGR